MRLRRLLHAVLVALLPLGAVSCGGKGNDRKPTYPVRGRVLFQGKPATGALVLFHPVHEDDPAAVRPHGQVNGDGAFVLSTYEAKDGAPAGEYVVTIDWRNNDPGYGPEGSSLLPVKYATPKASPLRATVKAQTNDLAPFQIAR
ncbi:MAG TPA: hypothetical protein VH643_29625 [Gemmataceae bacterium]|jgi:hypothetical protein